MFDIVATNTITIDSIDAHPMADTDIEVYYKVGSFSGSENNAAAWTLVGSAAVTAQAQGTPTPVPLNINVTIPAGQTYAFYVTSSNVAVSLNYTDGSTQGAVYTSDANMQILEGVGLEYPFSGTPFSPRMWNGTIHYSTGSATYSWSNGATTPSITVSPGSTTTYTVDVDITGCPNTLTESIQVSVSDVAADLGPDTTICVYNSLMLDAGGGALDTYQWSTAETTQSITVDGSTLGLGSSYIALTVSDQYGCNAYDSILVTVDQCAGISEYELGTFRVYPNPASSEFHVESTLANAKRIEIYDLTGSIIETRLMNNGSVIIDVDDYNNGMYFYKVFDEHNDPVHSGKIVVKK